MRRAEWNLKRSLEDAFSYERVQHELNKSVHTSDEQASKMHTLYKKKIEPFMYISLTAITAGLSAYIVISELMIMFQVSTQLIPSTNIFLVSLLLMYLALTTYYGLFNIRIASIYNLDPSGHTDSFSLLYSARLLTGLASPLCFNFLKLTNVTSTQFHTIMNPLDAIPVIGD